jgi:purine-binding chemotaxis protein CheW
MREDMEQGTQALAVTTPSAVVQQGMKRTASEKDRAGKYLVFRLGKEEFGAAVLKVREIIGMQDITEVPQTPAHVKGVINLRGKVIPILDLRLKFGMPAEAYTERTCIIVVRSYLQGTELLIGVVVDSVSEVLNLAASDIEDTPDFGRTAPSTYLIGMAKVKGQVKILLEIDQVLNTQELTALTGLID